MSQDWTSRVLTVALVVLMVTSTIAPVAAAGYSPATPAQAGSNSNSFDFSSSTTNEAGDTANGGLSADLGAPSTAPQTAMPSYAKADLADLTVTIGSPTTNSDGVLKVPVQVDGQYAEGQYPWRIPINVTIESGELRESTVVYLAPGRGSDDYRETAQFTLQFVQDDDTTHSVRATARPQFSDESRNGALEDIDQRGISVNGKSDESSVTTSGQIRNDDVSEPPNEVSHVTRFKATRRASGYLEDASIPVGRESQVSNFSYTRDANDKHAIFQSFRGDMEIGTLTTGVPNGSAQTLVIRYRSLEEDPVSVIPVTSSGDPIDRTYTLPANPADDNRCHAGDSADICVFRLSESESDTIGRQNELILAYQSKKTTALAVFCQDVVTGGMPEDGQVCGLGEVGSYSEGSITGLRAEGDGNTALEQDTLNVNEGTDVRIGISVKNNGNTPMTDTVQLTTTDPANFSARTQDVTLSGGESDIVYFDGYNIDRKAVRFTATFGESSEWVDVTPTGLGDDVPPVASPGGPYIVPLDVVNEQKTRLGLQTQTLSERPGPEWTKVGDAGSSGGTDEWTTYAYRVPVVGTLNGLEASGDNISYINSQIQAIHGGGTTIQDAYSDKISNTQRQLPANTNPSDWTLEDVQYTASVDVEREISPDRPAGYGWQRVDKYGSVATGEMETAQFRSLANGSEVSTGGTIIDTNGDGWVKQDDVPPERKLTGYVYNNTTTDPDFYEADDPSDGVDDWERYQYVETRYVVEDRLNWENRYQEERYDPGGNWTYVGQMDNGQYHYIRRTYKEVEVWTWRRPVYNWYYTYERPVTETTYEWERHIYDAKFVYQKSATSGSLSEWRGPLYKWEQQYETEDLTLNGDLSYDRGPVDLKGISAYQWEFEDATRTARSPNSNVTTRQYGEPFGVYIPSLAVWDKSGNRAENTTEVRVIKRPLNCPSPCEPYAAIPSLDAEAKRDPVDWQMESVSYKVDLSGKLHENAWEVNITAPASNGSFEQNIWRGYDIVNDNEEIHGTINPRVHDLGPGEVEFVVTATPVGESEPRITDTFTVYLCHADKAAFNLEEKGCHDLDPDNDNIPSGPVDGGDNDPYCSQANNAQDDTRCYCARNPGDKKCGIGQISATDDDLVQQKAVWDTREDWDNAIFRDHMTLKGAGQESNPIVSTKGEIRIGYERNESVQDDRYMVDADEGLLAFYDMEKKSIYYTNNWDLYDDSPGGAHDAKVYGDGAPNRWGGEFKNGDNWGDKPEKREQVPTFGVNGVFDSRGVHWEDTSYGHIEIISPRDNTPDGNPRAGQAMIPKLDKDLTVSFWAQNTQGYNNRAQERFWTMQDENNNRVDTAALHMRLQWGDCESNYVQTTCTEDEVHSFTRWHSDKSGVTQGYDTFNDNSTTYPTGDFTRNKSGDELNAMEYVKDGRWHHYAYVVDGGNDAGDTESTYLYVDGNLVYSRSFEEVYGSDRSFAYFTLNNGPQPVSHINRFIWGAGWRDITGLWDVMHGMKFDNIRVHNVALDESEISNKEYIDNHGALETSPKWLNESHDEYNVSNGVEVAIDGTLPRGTAVDVEVIPWKQDANGVWEPRYSDSATGTFVWDQSNTVPVSGFGVDTLSRVSIRVDAKTGNPTKSPVIDEVVVAANEKVQYKINNTDPEPYLLDNISNPSTLQSGDSVGLIGRFSEDDTGAITRYAYTVDGPNGQDSTISQGDIQSADEIPDVSYEFACAGTHEVTLQVQDEYGAVNSTSKTYTISNTPPTADATPNSQTISVGETANFDGTGSSDDSQILDYKWTSEVHPNAKFGPSTSYTYSSAGTYWVDLTVTDDGCAQDTERVQVEVVNDPPTADAGSDQTVTPGEQVTFDGSGSTDPNNDALTYEWDFDGDGTFDATTTDPTATTQHTYSSDGTRTVTLRVDDGYGGIDTDTMQVTVQNPYESYTWFDADFDNGWDGFNDYGRGSGRSSATYESYRYSAYMEGYSGSRIVSPSVDVEDARNLRLDYWVRAGDDAFSEDVDYGEDLLLQYRDSNGNWQTMRTFGGGNEGNIWDQSVSLPSGAYHSNLAIRFYHTGGSGNNFDYWHVDDVRLRGERFTGVSVSDGSIGETGTFSLNTGSSNDYKTLNFQNSYSNPVVIAKPLQANGGDPAHVRVRNVGSSSAQVTIEEFNGGGHTTETFHYVVMEQGDWTLDDGTHVVAGTVNTDDNFASVSFPSSFSNTPVVFTNSQTRNDGNAIVTRNEYVGTTGFSTRVQESEAGGSHATETVGYIAIDQGTGTTNGIDFEAYRECNCFDENWRQINFVQSYSGDRNFIADTQTEDGGDTVGLRYKDFYGGSVDVFVEEDEQGDSETSHTSEVVGYWVFDGDGILRGSGDVGGGGTTTQTLLNADFESGRDGFNTYNDAGRGSQTSNSGSYSLYTRHNGGSRAVSPSMDAGGASEVTVEYWVRKGDDAFSEDPDGSEDLTVQYKDSSGNWNTVKTHSTSSLNDGESTTVTLSLPSGAYHSNLQIRYRQTSGTGNGYDYWHVDDVTVTKTG